MLRLENIDARSYGQELELCQLYLAENVAKVLYNATNPVDPFDEDSGWWTVSCLKDYLDCVGNAEVSGAAWAAIAKVPIVS